MLDLHRYLSQAKTDWERRFIMQEIESTDRQIDSLVWGQSWKQVFFSL
jgi:hypothetical protein